MVNVSFNTKISETPIIKQPVVEQIKIDDIPQYTPPSPVIETGPSVNYNQDIGLKLPNTNNVEWWRGATGPVINEDRKNYKNIK